jgi:aminoglycoside phosphotransferase (APT) family kinase protein
MEAIRREYGYPVTTLTFVPEGMVGCHYVAGCKSGERTFVTVLMDGHMARLQAERLDFTLALMNDLYERGLFTAQPAVCRALDGRLKTGFQGMPLVVCEYIDGGNLGNAWPYPPEVLTGLGRLTAKLHRATAELDMDMPYVEQFRLPFEDALLTALADLERVPGDARPGLVELRDLVLPRREALLGLLARLHELGETARALNPPLVLVHTDMTPRNILRTPQGDLFIVDWEGVMLAPAEHDLFLFAGEGFSALLAEYVRFAGSPRLYPELFEYYFYRRNLEDFAGFLVSVMYESTTSAEDRYQIDLLEEDCLTSWPFLEKSWEWAREQLRAAGIPK